MGRRHMSMRQAQSLITMLGLEECTVAEVRAAVDDFSSDVIDAVDIQAKAGGSWTWHIAKFQRLLPFVVSRCAGFRLELEFAFTHFCNSRSNPWRLVLYSDEITPGNVLKLQNRRKAACWYLGIVEMMGFLRREEGWLTTGVIRASEVKKLHGGYSSVARALLRSLFLGNDGVSIAGVAVHLFGSPRLLYFRFEKRFNNIRDGNKLNNHSGSSARCQRLIRSMAAAHPLDGSNISSTTIINNDFHP